MCGNSVSPLPLPSSLVIVSKIGFVATQLNIVALLWTPQGSGANGLIILYILVINENGLHMYLHRPIFFSCLHLLCSGIIMHLYIGCPETFSYVSFRQDGILGIVMQ